MPNINKTEVIARLDVFKFPSKMYIKGAIIVTVLFFNLATCYNILVFFPYPAKSHTILGNGYVTHLVNAGHNVSL